MTIETFYKNGVHSVFSNFYMSNFRAFPFGWEDLGVVYTWRSVEHYYQAAKALRHEDMQRIAGLAKAGETKREGRKVELRPDWEEVKLWVMRTALEHKFAVGTPEAELLIASAGQELIEGNNWKDRFWGVDGYGQNWLGHLLMARRDWLICNTAAQGTLL